jgi:hypothetical protein
MTRARKNVKGEEAFGHVSRAHVRQFGFRWRAYRAGSHQGMWFGTHAEALAYALGEDKNDEA